MRGAYEKQTLLTRKGCAFHNAGMRSESKNGPLTPWQPVPAAFNMDPDRVDVWRIDIAEQTDRIERRSAWLNAEELARAARFLHEHPDWRRPNLERGFAST